MDLSRADDEEDNGVVVMICVKKCVRLVRIRDEARRVRDIEFPGCLASARRGNFACVADDLLDRLSSPQEMEGEDADDVPAFVQEVMEDIEVRPRRVDVEAEMDAMIEEVRAGNPPLEAR